MTIRKNHNQKGVKPMNQEAAVKQTGKASSSERVKSLVITAVCVALTYVFTACVNISLPLAKGGLIHLGNIPLFLAAILFGKKTGAIAGGIGMGLFDLLSGWAVWAPFTLVDTALMGYVIGAITEKKRGTRWNVIAAVIACVIKVVGYYIAEVIIYGNWIAPALSIPANIIQVVVAAIFVLPVVERLRKIIR